MMTTATDRVTRRGINGGYGYRVSMHYDPRSPGSFRLTLTGPRGGTVGWTDVDLSQAEPLRDAITEMVRAAWKSANEREPGGRMPAGCSSDCEHAGRWGASGVMPPGHHWQWRDAEHKSGYLAHTEGGSFDA